MWRVLLIGFSMLLMLPVGRSMGTSFVLQNFEQLVSEAEQIMVGTVASTTSRKLPTGAIVTEVTFATPRVLKGAPMGEITLEVLGGTVGEETLALAGVPQFERGVTYLVFVKDNRTAIFPVVGGPQGLFQIKRDAATGQDLVFDAQGNPLPSHTVNDVLGLPSAPSSQEALALPAPLPLETFVHMIQTRLHLP